MYPRTYAMLFLVALPCQDGFAKGGMPAFPGAEGFVAYAVGGRRVNIR